jgi:hypothetical protein
MKTRFFSALALVILCAGSCFAETTIKAELDKQSVSLDETVTYKVTVISTERQVPPPAFPDLGKRLAVLSQVQSSRVSFTAGGLKTMLVYVFVLLPREAGTTEIGPSAITVNGKKITSEKFTLEVKPGSGERRAPRQVPSAPPPARKPLPRDSRGMPQYDL